MKPPIVLTIAGSDSGGGAGIQADLKTFHAFGAFGTSAITAITAQNTTGVTAIHAVPVDIVREQIRAVADDLPPAAFKTGMLATANLVTVVAEAIAEHRLGQFVMDPVMVATSGDRLLAGDAERTIREKLLPLASLVTPNLDEATILVGFDVVDEETMRRAARRLVEMGAGAALLKGGHLVGDDLVDVLYDGSDYTEWRRPKLVTTSTHGTGCTLSAAIAAGLAHGRGLHRSVDEGLAFLQKALQSAPGLGRGHGPLNHMVAPVPEG